MKVSMNCLHNEYRNLKPKKGIQKWLYLNTISPKRVIKKTHASVVAIGDSIVVRLRRMEIFIFTM